MGRTGNIQPQLDNDEHLEVDGFMGKKVMPYVINPDGTADLQENPDNALEVDDYTTTDITYIGWAAAGATTNSAEWKVCKWDETTGAKRTWANGRTLYENIWDNRDSLTYL